MTSTTQNLATASHTEAVQENTWTRAAAYLLFLGPFFFLSYGFANYLAEHNPAVGHFVFQWEKQIPFLAWTIIPYWVIDLMYGLSVFICRTRTELTAHFRRLLAAQLVAVSCFILFPLSFSFPRPESSGFSGWLFERLADFDAPYNQAPSLHITLLVILWSLYVRHVPRYLIWPLHILSWLIAISVLTTYQHHFIDVPTGALLGWLCVYLWPLDGKHLFHKAKLTSSKRRRKLGTAYVAGSVFFATIALSMSNVALWLLWPAVSLFLVAMNYFFFGQKGFQKASDGKITVAVR